MIGTRVGNYEIKQKLGEGGMGAVYMGEHPLIGKRVAIKMLLEELSANEALVTRFFHEAKAVNDIRHQNIVDIVDFGKIDKEGGGKLVYLVMELLEGQSLAARLDTKRLTFDEIRHVMQQCCSGLAASHAKGIIHRDLKPDNLFLVRRGSDENFVKILDFGIAKLTTTSSTPSSKTRTGTLIGTPAYMSPEQCAGRGNIDARSDVYSLGIVMYEMLTGQVPFKGEGFGDIVVAQLTETAKKPSELRADVPPEFDAIVMKAIAKETEERFQSMEELGVALGDPGTFANSPSAVAYLGAVAAAPTAAVPVIAAEEPSAPVVMAAEKSSSDVPTIVAAKKKKDTTLSEAASESAVREPARRAGGRRAVIFGGAAAGIAALGVIAALALRGGGTTPAPMPPTVTAPQPTPAPTAAVAAPKPPEQVQVAITSDPAGAQVVRSDGVIVGVTPVKMKLDKGSPPLDVELTLEGYRPEKRTITSDLNREVDVGLARLPRHSARPAATVAKPDEDKPQPKPAEAKPVEAKPAEATPAEKKPDKQGDLDKELMPAQL